MPGSTPFLLQRPDALNREASNQGIGPPLAAKECHMPTMQSPPGPMTVVDGRQYLYFAGTGYLGLQSHPAVVAAACEAAEQYGAGSATSRSRTGFGDTPPALLVERRAAEFFGCSTALYLPSGYLGPQVLLATLRDTYDVLLLDECCHSAISSAATGCGKPVIAFRHCNPADLLERLCIHVARGHRPLVATDGVFSALGTIAPLAEYHEILQAYSGASLLVDDAHGVGVLGKHGRGLLERVGLFNSQVNSHEEDHCVEGPRVFFCASLSKALGGYGGIIPGTYKFVEWLRIESPIYSGASPLPPAVAASTAEGIRIAGAEPERREQLHVNAIALKSGLRRLGMDVADSPTPIVSVCLESAEAMRRVQADLAAQGILIAYFARYSGLPKQGALRIAVFATHTTTMIARLLDALGNNVDVRQVEIA